MFELLTSIDGSVIDGERVVTGTRLDTKNIDDVFKRASRALKDGTAEAYWSYLVDKEPDEDPIEAKITVAALALTEHVVDNVENATPSLATDWFKQHAKAVSLLSEADRSRYARIQAEAKEPTERPGSIIDGTIEEAISIRMEPDSSDDQLRANIRDYEANRWPKHVHQDADGNFWKKPSATDGLERKVLKTELSEDSLAAWYRNPTGGDRALCIPYRDSGTGSWARLFPDFVTFHDGGWRSATLDHRPTWHPTRRLGRQAARLSRLRRRLPRNLANCPDRGQDVASPDPRHDDSRHPTFGPRRR